MIQAKTTTTSITTTPYAPVDSANERVSPLQKVMNLVYGTIYGYEGPFILFGGLLLMFWLLYSIDFASIGSK